MNKNRRNDLTKLQDRIIAIKEAYDALREELVSIHEDLGNVKEAEQEAFDNMPEGLQQGERGQDMEAAISAMESAESMIEDLTMALETDLDDIVSSIDEAKGSQD